MTLSRMGGATSASPVGKRGRRWRIAAIVVAVPVLVLAMFVGRILWIGGTFARINPHFAGTCRLVEGPVGAEDLTINQRTGRAYLSASDRRALAAGRPVPAGFLDCEMEERRDS